MLRPVPRLGSDTDTGRGPKCEVGAVDLSVSSCYTRPLIFDRRYPSVPVSARTIVWICVVIVLLVAVGIVFALYRRDLGKGGARQSAIHAQTARTSFGNVEYLLEGDGPVVLVSHVITGGVDQARGSPPPISKPRRMGPPDQEGLRGGSLGRQQVEDLREPATRPGPRLPELISSPCLRGGGLSLRYPCTGAPSACAHRNTPKLPISP